MIHIEKMTEADIDFVCQNETLFFKSTLGEETIKSFLAAPFSKFFCLFDDDLRIGYLSSQCFIPQAEIMNFFIIKDYQKRGIGKWFLTEIINEFIKNGIRVITLEVRVSNKKAINLYESLGFKNVYIRKNYYQDGEDAILMLKEV